MQDKKQQLELDMEQQTESKLGNEYVNTIYCHSAYLTYVKHTLCKIPGCMNHRLWNHDCWDKYQLAQI